MLRCCPQGLHMAVLENAVAAVPTFSFYRGADRVGAFGGANKDQLMSKLQQLRSGEA